MTEQHPEERIAYLISRLARFDVLTSYAEEIQIRECLEELLERRRADQEKE